MGEASNDVRYRVFENWCLVYTNEKHSLQQAADNLIQILNDHVMASFAYVCLMYLRLVSERQYWCIMCDKRMLYWIERRPKSTTVSKKDGEDDLEYG